MPKPKKYKSVRQQLTYERNVSDLNRIIEADRRPVAGKPLPIPPLQGTPAYALRELREVMKLPAAEDKVLALSKADKLSDCVGERLDRKIKSIDERIDEGMDAEVAVQVFAAESAAQGTAMKVSEGLVKSICKAQAKKAPGIQINQQINTPGVSIHGTDGGLSVGRSRGLSRGASASSNPPSDPSGDSA